MITIRNCGIGKEQADKIITLLKTALADRDISAMNAKLDELIEVAGKGQQTTVNAPITQQNSGGCNQQVVGGNNNTNSCMPPQRHLSQEQESGIELLALQLPDGCQMRFNSADNGESQAFEKELHDAFAKKKAVLSLGWGIAWHPKATLAVRVKTVDDPCAPYGLTLAKGIHDLGIALNGAELSDQLPAKTVEIVVGEL